MDFITDLPHSQGFNTILSITDRFTKITHFFPYIKSLSNKEITNFITCEVFRHYGLPNNIISDRGRPQFISLLEAPM
jgi:hypothetical protein